MTKIDLITGYLGSGKTTFLKKYASYLINKGLNICILENDYGAVNVDMMLINDLRGEHCELEMVSGGCDSDCHKRRFKTKLIAMGMKKYDRVIIEPSGIFDVDEFFDSLYDEPLCNWYSIGNVFAIADSESDINESKSAKYVLASELANAGKIILSKTQNVSKEVLDNKKDYLISLIKEFCNRDISNNIYDKDWDSLTDSDFDDLINSGYKSESYIKEYNPEGFFNSCYFMDLKKNKEEMVNIINTLFSSNMYGSIIRVKGFFMDNNSWYEVNATSKALTINPINNGQDVFIVIGEGIKEDLIKTLV